MQLGSQHGKTQGRLISCFNRRKAHEAEESRYDEIQSALQRLSKGKTIKPEMEPFFGTSGRVLESKLNEERQFDGMSFMFTTSKLAILEAFTACFDKGVVECREMFSISRGCSVLACRQILAQ